MKLKNICLGIACIAVVSACNDKMGIIMNTRHTTRIMSFRIFPVRQDL